MSLRELLGPIDIYLLDQLLKGRLLAHELAPEVAPESFQVADLAEIPFPAGPREALRQSIFSRLASC